VKTSEFDYNLPDEFIAQAPAEPRDSCKLLILNRSDSSIEHKIFSDIIDYLNPHDLLVVNKTRVISARLLGNKAYTGGAAEFLMLSRREDLDTTGHIWECLVRPARRLAPGTTVEFREAGVQDPSQGGSILFGEILDEAKVAGSRIVKFSYDREKFSSLGELVHKVGAVPLPPYITGYEGDPELYQTVYAMQEEHSAAAPTAGLHFTPELLERCKNKGVELGELELEVGIDTFRLVTEENIEDHQMHTERYHVSQDLVDKVHACQKQGGRVIAVGTTSVRSLESAYDKELKSIVAKENATTDLYLTPGSTFNVVDAMITNFHVPKSSLMMLVSAFASMEQIRSAYQSALDHHYRFLSFGDAMFIQ